MLIKGHGCLHLGRFGKMGSTEDQGVAVGGGVVCQQVTEPSPPWLLGLRRARHPPPSHPPGHNQGRSQSRHGALSWRPSGLQEEAGERRQSRGAFLEEGGLKLSFQEQEQISSSQRRGQCWQGHLQDKRPGAAQEGPGRQSAERGDTL